MKLLIINGSPQPPSKSTTACVAEAFGKGLCENGDIETEILHLCKKEQWPDYYRKFNETEYIVFAFPLYVECMPGIALEFLDGLFPYIGEDPHKPVHKIGFIIQGGFEEAHQLRCAEHYCRKLPKYLNGKYCGTLIKGGMFGLQSFRSEAYRNKMLNQFHHIGREYGKTFHFDGEHISAFAGPEYLSRGVVVLNTLFHPLSRIIWSMIGKKLGANGKLNQKVYDI